MEADFGPVSAQLHESVLCMDGAESGFKFDRIGYWSEIKLEIIRKYATAYSTILAAQPSLTHVYIDGFAGAGEHLSRETGILVPGSPGQALSVQPPFREFFFVDMDGN